MTQPPVPSVKGLIPPDRCRGSHALATGTEKVQARWAVEVAALLVGVGPAPVVALAAIDMFNARGTAPRFDDAGWLGRDGTTDMTKELVYARE